MHNAFEATRRCLAALERHTAAAHGVVVVDDASIDARIPGLLRDFAARRPGTRVLANPRNLGFVGSANLGLREAPGDAIVLTSDTEVTAGWVEGLVRCRRSDPAIGIACPLSNNATLLSVVGVAELYRRDDGTVDVEALGACVSRTALRTYVRLPTALGFCMLLTRELIDTVGRFDPAFGRGYCEDNDLSMRALARGFQIACADDVYVHHSGGASFGAAAVAGEEVVRNRALIDSRWPAFAPAVAAWWRSNPLRPTIERVIAAAERERRPGRPRVLLVTHRLEGMGGIEEHQRELVQHLQDEVAFTVAVPLRPCGLWPDLVVERTSAMRVVRLTTELATAGIRALEVPAEPSDETVEASFRRLLAGGYDVVHFLSLLGWNTLRLPRIARESGARVIAGVHDKAWMCADYNMVLGIDGGPCGRRAASGADAGCVECIGTKASAPGGLADGRIAAWLDTRRAAAADALAAADAIVCPSDFAAQGVSDAFGALPACVIGHGAPAWPALDPIARAEALRVAFIGHLSLRKGGALLIEAARRIAGARMTFEVFGPVDTALAEPALAAGIRLRGPYRNADLPRLLASTDLVVVTSLVEESFCRAVTEAQQLGIPVAASAIGAIPERVRDGESGFLFPPGDAAALVALLARLRDDRGALEDVRRHLLEHRQKTPSECAREYLALYHATAR